MRLPLHYINRSIFSRVRVWGLFFGLYVGVTILNFSQDCRRIKLCCAVTLFFSICFDVRYAFLVTRPTWPYVETASVWLWRHVSFGFFSTETQRTRPTQTKIFRYTYNISGQNSQYMIGQKHISIHHPTLSHKLLYPIKYKIIRKLSR
jgi:hypothetical protein